MLSQWEDGPPSDHLKNLLLSREDLNTQFIEAMDQGRKAADNLSNSIALSGAEIIQAIEAAYATWSTDSARLPFITNSAHVSASEVGHYHLVALFPTDARVLSAGVGRATSAKLSASTSHDQNWISLYSRVLQVVVRAVRGHVDR